MKTENKKCPQKSWVRPLQAAMVFVLTSASGFAQPGLPPPFQQPPHREHAPLHRPFDIFSQGKFGDPLPNLTIEQMARFLTGLEDFEEVETAESGLGPIFNNTSCVACHAQGASGGGGTNLVTRFGRLVNGHFDPLNKKGGSLLQQFAIDAAGKEKIPREANVVARRQATPLFGLGLIDAIPDDAIRRHAARPNADGIQGRVSEVLDVASGEMRVGRFGWKAQQATLLAFSGDAYVNELGITSRFFPQENAPNGNTNLLARFDAVSDPEEEIDEDTGQSEIDTVADFMRFLAPPPRLPLTFAARNGAGIFSQIGCAICHQPVMFTGPNNIAALDRKPVELFSDLLLHNMGSLGDRIVQGVAAPREMKTAPLWGLRVSAPYLHDGRAKTVDRAIRLHDGQGAHSRNRYLRLTPGQKQELLEFLNSI